MARLGLVAMWVPTGWWICEHPNKQSCTCVNILVHEIQQLRYKQNYMENKCFQKFKKLSQVPLHALPLKKCLY